MNYRPLRTLPQARSCTLIVAALLLSSAVKADQMASGIQQIIAHRGSSADRPENTLAGILRAIEVGATAVEVDVRTTRDGRLVVLHDATVDRTTNGSGRLAEKSQAEVRTLDAGSWFDPKYREERIPTLNEVLILCGDKIDVLLDLKLQDEEFAKAVAADVKAHGEPKRTIVGVRSVEQARLFRRLLPSARQLGLIPNPGAIEAFAKTGVETIRLWPNWLDDEPSLSDRVREAGTKLHLNGATGQPEEVRALLKHKPDSLSADDPARLVKTLASLRLNDRDRNDSGQVQESGRRTELLSAGKGNTDQAVAAPLRAELRSEIPAANTWVAADIDWKKTLAEFREDASWVTGDGYSDNSFRTKTGEVLIRTGIASRSAGWNPGFYTNTTVAWDPKTDTAQVVDVFRWGGGSGGHGKLLSGFAENPTPSPRHTYDGMAYVPEEDTLYLHMGATWRTGGNGVTEDAKRQHTLDERESTWKYTFADGRWTRIDHNVLKFWPSGLSPYEQHLVHWPQENKLLFLNDNGDRYAEFDLKSQQWQNGHRIEGPNSPKRLYNARSTWDSKRQLWVFRLGPDLCTFDPKTKKYVALPRCWGLPPRTDENEKSDSRYAMKGVVYIPKHDVYLVTGPTGNDTMVYDVTAGKWSELKAGGIELVNGYLQYDPATDLVLMNYQLQCFKLRYTPPAQ